MRRHLEVIRRKELLELALEKMESLKRLDGLEKRSSPYSTSDARAAEGKGKRWGLF